jgi:hypothetical protein
MEDPAILTMNLDHFRRLLKIEADPAKRQMVLKLIRETEAKLQKDRHPSKAPSYSGFHRGLLK